MTDTEFEGLLRAHALDALQPAERDRLDDLAAAAPERAAAVAEVDAVQRVFAAERQVRAEVLREGAPFADESTVAGAEAMARLTAAAGAAENELRAQLLRPRANATVVSGPASPWPRRLGVAVLAAAAVLALWFGIFAGEDGPRLDPRRPDDLRAGDRAGPRLQLVLLEPTLTPEARTIAWAAVPGASGYDASILDRDDAIVLERDDERRASTQWELTTAEYGALLALRPLRLRVTALDGVGLPIGSSGDLVLTLR